MTRLPVPPYAPAQIFRACIGRIRDAESREKLESITQEIAQAEIEYSNAATQIALHTLERNSVFFEVDGKVLEDLYTDKMARTTGPARAIYEQIRSAPPLGTCPLCNHMPVKTLDHHLPKSLYPALSVAPTNLVPACSDCNKRKMDTYPTCSERQAINPYFDDIDDSTWLYANVNTSTAVVSFSCDPPSHWSTVKSSRVKEHFRLLELGKLYSAQAACELSDIREYLRCIQNRAGAVEVKLHLEELAASCSRRGLNTWKTAMYTALSRCQWFYEGGYLVES